MKLKLASTISKVTLLMAMASLQPTLAQAQIQQFDLDKKGNPIITQEIVRKIVETAAFEILDEGSVVERLFDESEYLKLSDLRGKIVVIDFWQTWCGPCLASFKGFHKAKETWPDKIEILAASPDWADGKRKIRQFNQKHNYDFNFVLAYELEKDLNLSSIPYKIIIAPDGSLITSVSGSKGPEGEFKVLEDLINTWFSNKES